MGIGTENIENFDVVQLGIRKVYQNDCFINIICLIFLYRCIFLQTIINYIEYSMLYRTRLNFYHSSKLIKLDNFK